MTISDAEARIRKLQEEITKYNKKKAACDRIKPAYQSNKNRAISKWEEIEAGFSKVNNNVESAADAGFTAFSEGACYMENEEGTSTDFENLKSENEDSRKCNQEGQSARDELISKLEEAIAKIDENKERFIQHIKQCESEIARLRDWIAEEIRRQEEEKAEEQGRNWTNQIY